MRNRQGCEESGMMRDLTGIARLAANFAAIVAAVSFVVFEWTGAVYYLLAGVLAGNVWEGWRRYRFRSARKSAAGTSTTGSTRRP